MDRVQQVLRTIQENLKRLTATQKLLIGSLVVVLLMTMFIVSQYAGGQQTVDLLPAAATPEQQQQAIDFLRESAIEHKVRDGKPQVTPDRRRAIIAQMGQSGALPTDTTMLFADLIDKQSWTMSTTQQQQLYNIALQNELSNVIAQMRGIRSATVIIDAPPRRGLGAAVQQPTASATVYHDESALSQEAVDAIASLIAGAKAGLSVENVMVIDGTTNRQRRARSADEMFAGSYLELQAKVEERYRRQLRDTVNYIDGVIVAVTAQVDVTRRTSNLTEVLQPGAGTVTVPTSESDRSVETSPGQSAAEPGARSNVGLDIQRGGSGGGAAHTESETTTELQTEFGRRTETTHDPRGMPTKINAAINVPRSWVRRVVQAQRGEDGGEPDEAALTAFFEQERQRIEQRALTLLETQNGDGASVEGSVVVSMVHDPAPPATQRAGGIGAGLVGSGGETVAVGDWIKTVALGGLAVAALGLMALALKKAGKRPEMPTADELVGMPPSLDEDVEVMGEASEADAALSGIELSDDEVESKQMLNQIGSMVKDTPSESASLLNRWISSEQ